MINNDVASIVTIEDLQQYVYGTLCADNELLSDAFPKSTIPLRNSKGEICGLMYCVSGPRTVEFTAIWEKKNNRVFFYDPNGKRYRQTTLENTPVGEIKYENVSKTS